MSDYYIGQIFENEYPIMVSSFATANNCRIETFEKVERTVDRIESRPGVRTGIYVVFTDGTEKSIVPCEIKIYVEGTKHMMPRLKIVKMPEPTPEEIQEQLTVAVQKYLDTTAQKLNYDNCLAVCSYVNTGVTKFDEEGAAFRQWRSAVWEKGYEIVDAVKAGTRDIPTEEELFAELPTIQLDREELKETSTLGLAKVGI